MDQRLAVIDAFHPDKNLNPGRWRDKRAENQMDGSHSEEPRLSGTVVMTCRFHAMDRAE